MRWFEAEVILPLVGMLGGTVAWWTERRARLAAAGKVEAERDASVATAAGTIVDGAGHLADAVTAQLDRIVAQQEQTDRRLESAVAELAEVQDRRRTLERHVLEQQRQIDLLGDSLHKLRADHEQQRQLLVRLRVVGLAWMREHTSRIEALGGVADPIPTEFEEEAPTRETAD